MSKLRENSFENPRPQVLEVFEFFLLYPYPKVARIEAVSSSTGRNRRDVRNQHRTRPERSTRMTAGNSKR